MFIVYETIAETIQWPVKVTVPRSGGGNKTYEFTGTFKRLNDDERKELEELTKEAANEREEDWIEGYLDRTMRVMTDWGSSVVNPAKEPIPYTRDNFRKVLKAPGGIAVVTGITRALSEIEAGIKAKN